MSQIIPKMPVSASDTIFAGFAASVSSAFSLTIVTEFGDRTFFIAALLATKYEKWAVLMGTLAALFIQSALAATMGRLLHYLPSETSNMFGGIPIDDYCAAVFLLIFAFIHLKSAFYDAQEEKDDETIASATMVASLIEEDTHLSIDSFESGSRRLKNSRDDELLKAKSIVAQIRSKGKWDTITKSFYLIFAAELGDKSMIATVALATAQNPYGVVLGAMGGHFLVTLCGVYAGAMLHGYLSEKVANGTAGFLFLIFGVLTLVEGLSRQGIIAWPVLAYASMAVVGKGALLTKNRISP